MRCRSFLLAVLLLLCSQLTAAAQQLRMGVQSAFVVDPQVLFLGPNMAAARHFYDQLRWQGRRRTLDSGSGD